MDTLYDTLGAEAQARASRWLASAGLRPTRQRRALAAHLVGDGRDRPVPAETQFEAARGSGELFHSPKASTRPGRRFFVVRLVTCASLLPG